MDRQAIKRDTTTASIDDAKLDGRLTETQHAAIEGLLADRDERRAAILDRVVLSTGQRPYILSDHPDDDIYKVTLNNGTVGICRPDPGERTPAGEVDESSTESARADRPACFYALE